MVFIGRYIPNVEFIHDASFDKLTHNSEKPASNLVVFSKLQKLRNQAKAIEEMRHFSEVKILTQESVQLHYDLDLLKQEKVNQEFIARLKILSKTRKVEIGSYNDISSTAEIWNKSDDTRNKQDRARSDSEEFYGTRLNNEFEVVPFIRFTLQRLYLVDPGLGKRVVEKPIGYKRTEINEVLQLSLNFLNSGKPSSADSILHGTTNFKEIDSYHDLLQNEIHHKSPINDHLTSIGIDESGTKLNITEKNVKEKKLFVEDDFLEGLYRNIPTIGTLYELYFREMNEVVNKTDYKYNYQELISNRYVKVVIQRPYSRQFSISSGSIQIDNEVIEIILALSGRIEAFRRLTYSLLHA